MATATKDAKSQQHELHQIDAGKYVRYTPEQVEALERVYMECPKPSSLRRQQLIRECPILCNIEPKQIKVWFQNRRCREKQRKEASRLQTVNRKLTAMNKLLMEENDRLQKQVSHLVYENGYMRQQLHTPSAATTDTSCESVVSSGQHQQQHNKKMQYLQRDANNLAGLLAIAEETLSEFLSKATGTSVDWVQMVGMKPGPDSIGIIAVSHNCSGVAARACGLVSLEPTKVAEILKARPSWYRDCRCLNVATVIPAGNGGNIELIYMQTYAPTTLAAARDFWTLRYTTGLEDGSLVICERSLTSSTGGPTGPSAPNFVRAEMLPSGYLIRPCDGGGSMIHIVDHIDLDAMSVPEVLRPLYESPKIVAHKMTIAALRHLRQIAHETSGEFVYSGCRQPAVLRTFSQRLSRGFNDAINGFMDDGWSLMSSDGGDDVTITTNSSPSKLLGSVNSSPHFAFSGGVLCAKASMLLQNVPPALLVRFLREHRSEWAEFGADAYSTSSMRASSCPILDVRGGCSFHGGQVIFPLAQTVENEEFLEMIRLEGHGFGQDDVTRDMYLLQLCSGIDEKAAGACSQLVFAPIDESFADDAPLLPSGFRVIPIESKTAVHITARTLDLASALEVGSGSATRPNSEGASTVSNLRSVLTIAFQFTYENHFRENIAAMARQYVRSIVASVQRVAMAIAPSRVGSLGPKHLAGSPEGLTLARWISSSYKFHTGADLFRSEPDDEPQAGDPLLKLLWHYPDAIMCCTLKASNVFTFANQAGLDMLETTLIALQDITLEKILNDSGRKVFCAEFSKIMQQGFAYLPGGVCLSSMGRPASYDQAIAWKVLDEENCHHCLAFMFMNWSFV
ncbi:Homeobox-leucine zipper protein HOX32 [Platanthera guangdongensis]|uniref:Homeobox-leucine zipper protein HOX32 n=1 Tax=Platanthera guangdongensis TaxID=2320717 RepID=A0ABR2MZU9_9ASPA